MRIITTLLVLLFAGGCASSLISEDNEVVKEYGDFLYQESPSGFILTIKNKNVWTCGYGSCGLRKVDQIQEIALQICTLEEKGSYAKLVTQALDLNDDVTFYCLDENEHQSVTISTAEPITIISL